MKTVTLSDQAFAEAHLTMQATLQGQRIAMDILAARYGRSSTDYQAEAESLKLLLEAVAAFDKAAAILK